MKINVPTIASPPRVSKISQRELRQLFPGQRTSRVSPEMISPFEMDATDSFEHHPSISSQSDQNLQVVNDEFRKISKARFRTWYLIVLSATGLIILGGIIAAIVILITWPTTTTTVTTTTTTTVTTTTTTTVTTTTTTTATTTATTTSTTTSTSTSTSTTSSATMTTTSETTTTMTTSDTTTTTTVSTTTITTTVSLTTTTTPASTIFSVSPSSTTGWVSDSKTYTSIVTGTLTLTFTTEANSQDDWYLDDISLTNTANTVSINNGDFETNPSSAWSQAGGSCSGGGAYGIVSSSNCRASSSRCYENDCNGPSASISQTFAATAGETYTISFWYYCNQNSGGGSNPTLEVTIT